MMSVTKNFLSKIRKLLPVLFIAMLLNISFIASPVVAQSKNNSVTDVINNANYSRGYSKSSLELKFKPNSRIYISGGTIHGDAAKISQLEEILGKNNVKSARKLFAHAENRKANESRKAKLISGKSIPNLEDYVTINLKNNVSMEDIVSQLTKLDFVLSAFPTMLPAPTPSTPDFSEIQHYLTRDRGVNADFMHQVDGGKGENVKIADIEYSWNENHEDLTSIDSTNKIAVGDAVDPFNNTDHGTAVAGILVGDHNEFGINGITPEAELLMVNSYSDNYGWDPAEAIYQALPNLNPGDVILLEQQAYGPTPVEADYVPIEIIPSVYDAIVTATSMGVIVVEPAGNGNQNLDDNSYYGNKFPFDKPDSGAIIVGASNGCTGINQNSRANFSTYGNRVDVYAHGGCVASTGYGYLHNTSTNTKYTSSFGGTSSASAITAGIVASISSAAEEVGIQVTPANIRTKIKSTGLVQTTSATNLPTENIGTLTQARDAILSISNKVIITSCYIGGWNEWMFLNIGKNFTKISTPEATQKYTVNALSNHFSKNPSPVDFTQTGNKCIGTEYTANELTKLESTSYNTGMSLQESQAYSAILFGALILFWGLN